MKLKPVLRSLTSDYEPAVATVPMPADKGPDLAEIGRKVMRRRGLIVITVLILTTLSWVAVSNLTPRYSASVLMLMGPGQRQILDLGATLAGLPADADLVESEIQVIRSPRIAKAVIQKLDLTERYGTKTEPGLIRSWLDRIAETAREHLPATLAAAFTAAPAPAPRDDAPLVATLDTLARNMSVTSKGRSRVVEVTYQDEDPALAARIVNAVVDAYITDQLDMKFQGTEQANRWLNDRVEEQRQKVIQLDREIQRQNELAGITQGKDQNLLSEQISQLSEQLIGARAEVSAAEARLRQAEQGVRGQEAGDVLITPLLQRLREQNSDLTRQITRAATMFGEKHPEMLRLRAQLADVASAMRAETGRVINDLRTGLEVARSREGSIVAALAEQSTSINRIKALEVDIRALQREAEASRTLYDRILLRAKETSVEGGLQQPNAQVISYADVPDEPSFPNTKLFMLVTVVGAVLATTLLVVVVESLDHGFRDTDQLEQALGIPAIAMVPVLRGILGKNGRPGTCVLDKPFSAFAESIRGLYTSLILSNVDRTPRVVLVTSSLPGEGKSSTTAALARLVAGTGKKVLLIDCDLRRPSAHRHFGVAVKPGLVDLLAGRVQLDEAIQKDQHSSAMILPAGSRAQIAPDIFASENMQRLLRQASSNFDLVLLDSAPVLAVSDTRTLCRHVDKVLFMVRWQHTRGTAAQQAMRQVLSAGGDVAGTVLTLVDGRRIAQYSAANYYHKQIQNYHTDT